LRQQLPAERRLAWILRFRAGAGRGGLPYASASDNLVGSVAASAVGDAGQDIVGGGYVAAVTISSRIGREEVLRAGLVLVAGYVALTVEIENVGAYNSILQQAGESGLSVVLGFVVFLQVLVDGGGLGPRAIGVDGLAYFD